MPPVNRNQPKRGRASESSYSLVEFMRECPNDAACLDMLWRERYAPDGHRAACPKCKQTRKFHRIASRPAYSCDTCGHALYPLAGTIFHKSSTSLHLWFYAIYIMASTRCGVSAKQLERELGVTYKTAWRMFNLIRNKLMADETGLLCGDVEVDEASVDGKPRNKHFISHSRINHSAGIYVQGDTHTNTVEGFFGNLKTGIRGNYEKVSHKWLQGYLNEFTWR
jgi:hypothetical protein